LLRVERWRYRLGRQFFEERLLIEQIHLAGTAFHEAPDFVLGAWGDVRGFRRERVGGGGGAVLGQHRGQRNGGQAAARLSEKLAAGTHVPMMFQFSQLIRIRVRHGGAFLSVQLTYRNSLDFSRTWHKSTHAAARAGSIPSGTL